MKSTTVLRILIGAIAAPAFVACASTQTSDTSAAGALAVPNVIEIVPVSASEAVMLRRMTDPNILGHVSMSDSVEVVMAKFAQQRTKNDDVLDFARKMDVDHSTDMQAVRNIAQTTGLGMHTIVGELAMSHMGAMVDSVGPQISGMTFDRNYILANVQMHQHMLAELETLHASAQNATVREHLAQMIPTVQSHLDRARDIARKYDWASRKALRATSSGAR